ncbi:MAG TPA: oxygenase MpaB family protein [Chitinophagaceae bacterium]
MEYFVEKGSIVREIWGKGDTVLFIFAGASAEFALNKAVDWLYFTGKLPADPLGRLFSTVSYARNIVFLKKVAACKAIDKVTAIHSSVEMNRGSSIPDWAYRDVLFMLIHYSIASFELLERKLTVKEKEEVFDVFRRFGLQMNLRGLPGNFNEWLVMRNDHLNKHLEKSVYTVDLYKQYKKHLGTIRYKLLLQGQILVVPQQVIKLLQLGKFSFLRSILILYKLLRKIKIDWFIKSLILPDKYKTEIKNLDSIPPNE